MGGHFGEGGGGGGVKKSVQRKTHKSIFTCKESFGRLGGSWGVLQVDALKIQ